MNHQPVRLADSTGKTGTPLKTVGISPPAAYEKNLRLFAALMELEPVSFQPVPDVCEANVDSLIIVGEMPDIALHPRATKPTFLCALDTEQVTRQTGTIKFSSARSLTEVLRGQVFHSSKGVGHLKSLPDPAEVLASMGENVLWAQYQHAGVTVDVVSSALPAVDDRQPYLFSHFQPDNFIGLLPLIHFIRAQVLTPNSPRVALRACFMFDDPNLHWSSFGFVDYRSLVASARRHRYHASFATVPSDGWYVHEPAARIFRQNVASVSFLIHGNNHIRNELARDYSDPRRIEIAAQALRRIEKLGKRAKLSIPQVMAAPHGACSEAMAEAMLLTGYASACISRGSLMYHNPDKTWRTAVGMTPAEMLGSGFPVIPRIGLIADSRRQIILAAFLEQPIIFVGHHNDLRNGYGLLEELSSFINGLGQVSWQDMDGITQTNFTVRTEGDLAEISLFSREVNYEVPPGFTRLCIRRPWLKGEGRKEELLEIFSDGQKISLTAGERSSLIDVEAGSKLKITSPVANKLDFHSVSNPPIDFWAIIRRLLAETRDRVLPLTNALRRWRHA